MLQAHSASPCTLIHSSSAAPDVGTSSSAGQSSRFDVDDVTHIITVSPTFKDYVAVESYNARAEAGAARSGRQASASPLSPGKRGDLIAVVTVGIISYVSYTAIEEMAELSFVLILLYCIIQSYSPNG